MSNQVDALRKTIHTYPGIPRDKLIDNLTTALQFMKQQHEALTEALAAFNDSIDFEDEQFYAEGPDGTGPDPDCDCYHCVKVRARDHALALITTYEEATK